jgi:predicted tellurium resistance membrane protein TerC
MIMLIGFYLVSAGIGYELPKSSLYFAMFYSLGVEAVSIMLNNKKKRFIEKGE